MKSAHDWCEELGLIHHKAMYDPTEGFELTMEQCVKQIQLDAWKQGMMDASEMVDNWHLLDKKDNVELRDDICNAADDKDDKWYKKFTKFF